MTKLEPSDFDQDHSDGAVNLKRALIGFGGGFLLIFVAGIIAGFASAAFEHGGPSLIDGAVLGAMLLAALGVAYAMWWFWPRGTNEPEAPRVKSARMILIVAVVISFALGVLLAVAGDSASDALSNGPVSQLTAIVSIALWLFAVPVLTWMWWRRVDEHEAGAYREGAFVAVHVYLFLAPTWWMASRAGWLPDQDPMIVLLIVSFAWTAVWFVKRYL